jgi:cystathionine beta-lyase
MKYDFDEVIDRRGSQCIKWDGGDLIRKYGITKRFDADTIPLFVADMDFACPQPVLEALRTRVDQRMFGYSSHLTDSAYSDAVVAWFSRRQKWKITPGDLVYCPGTVYALDVAVKAYTKPHEGVIIQRPVYSPFTKVIEKNGRVVVNNELINDGGYYTMDFEDLEAKASNPDTTLMFLCSPHNPVGRIWQPEELRKVARICAEHQVVLISDEIHGDLIRVHETFFPIANIADDENIIVCTAINKTFNLAGLHCSNIVIRNSRLRRQFQHQLGMAAPSPFAISALIAAYNESEEWLEQLKAYIDGNFEFLEQYLKGNMPEVVFRMPEGTYIAWLDFSGYGIDADEVHRRIYDKANVALEGGKRFGEQSVMFQRLCLPVPRSILHEALRRIKEQFRLPT